MALFPALGRHWRKSQTGRAGPQVLNVALRREQREITPSKGLPILWAGGDEFTEAAPAVSRPSPGGERGALLEEHFRISISVEIQGPCPAGAGLVTTESRGTGGEVHGDGSRTHEGKDGRGEADRKPLAPVLGFGGLAPNLAIHDGIARVNRELAQGVPAARAGVKPQEVEIKAVWRHPA